ncbi:MAG: glycosyltransferase family 2 protein [Colwellia sp.]|nr:glycosyltransferase family 2 protein [Colwellia sp.]
MNNVTLNNVTLTNSLPPKVSVIIPTYNRNELVLDAIDSVLEQTFQNFEIIIVDDGSTDDTKTHIDKYQKKDTRIKYIFQENQGVSIARNTGIDAAQGQYIAFLDSDDRFLIDKLERQVLILDKHLDVGLIYGKILVENTITKKLGSWGHAFAGSLEKTEMHQKIYKRHLFFYIGTTLIRKEIIGNIKFDSRMKTGEDFLFYLLLSKQTKFYGIDEAVSLVRREHESIIQKQKNKKFDEAIAYTILKKEYKLLTHIEFLKGLSYHYLYFAKDYYEDKIYWRYFLCLAKCFTLNPFNIYLYKHILGDLILRIK